MIERALLAMVDLHFAVGIVDVRDAEKMLEEELLRAFAEVFELRRRDRLQRRARPLVEKGRVHVAVEGALGARHCE